MLPVQVETGGQRVTGGVAPREKNETDELPTIFEHIERQFTLGEISQ